ncbi:transposase [Sphingomonas spermidinifaciens]|uniref:Transposase n=1 Tax=Sphingomonas spermidinifaciens TaxID=1141889 RepID=A0A2A4B996_9SPHN|nr:transposase [Sphingomonas spermidinifaciens]PCD04236.1 transposase [Sphingomonas spermidinifaciens]
MSRLIAVAPSGGLDAAECLARAKASGADVRDEAGLATLADDLAALSADRGLVARVAERVLAAGGADATSGGYGAQALLLAPPGQRFVLRAAFWPGIGDAILADSGPAAFFYGVAHDHDFAFLTCGHSGPGYWSDEWEVPEPVAGVPGEAVALTPLGRHRLAPGDVRLYRAGRDVHAQAPPTSFSVSVNLLARDAATAWIGQYRYDTDRNCIAGELGGLPAALLLDLAVELGDGLDLAERFAARHRQPRMRVAAWRTLARVAPATLRPILAREEVAADRMLAAHARAILTDLDQLQGERVGQIL